MNVPLFKVHMGEDADTSLSRVLQSGYISQGPVVEQFEGRLRQLVGNQNCLTVNSATAGLTLAVRMVAEGREVVSTPLTCFATTSAILANACIIRWTDVDNTCGMCLNSLAETLTPQTKAIIVVHWGGVSIDMDRLFEIRDEAEQRFGHPIYVIQDCAHALLSTYGGKVLGANAERERSIGVFSFQAIKHLTTGDGGMIVVPPHLFQQAKRLRWFGIDRDGMTSRLENDIPESGYKFHMNDINATLGLTNLTGLLERREQARIIARIYDENITCPRQTVQKLCNPNYWLYTLFMPNRTEYIKYMATNGIQVSPVHKRNDINSCVEAFRKPLPTLDRLEQTIVSIPVGWWVTEEDARKIYSLTDHFYQEHQGTLATTPSTTVVREARAEDAKEALILYNQERSVPIELTPDHFRQYIDEIWPSERLFVVLVSETVVGMGKLIVETKLGYRMARIEDIYVDKHYRRKGYGTALIQHMVERAKTNKVDRIVLGSPVPDFYTPLGFRDKGVYMVLKC